MADTPVPTTRLVAWSLVSVTGLGRTPGIVCMAGHDEALRELTAPLRSAAFMPAAAAGTLVGASAPSEAGLVGRWWKAASTAGGVATMGTSSPNTGSYSYEHRLQERQAGTFIVQGNRITLTTAAGHATSRIFAFECVGSKLRLEFRDEKTGVGDGYWSERSC